MEKNKSRILVLATGAPIGFLCGLIGLGGAEFRIPWSLLLKKRYCGVSFAYGHRFYYRKFFRKLYYCIHIRVNRYPGT